MATTPEGTPYVESSDLVADYPSVSLALAEHIDDLYSTWTSFTPIIVGSTTAGTGTYTNQLGRYNVVGKICFILMNLSWTAHTGTGNMRIEDLPFGGSGGYNPPMSITYSGLLSPASTFAIGNQVSTNSYIQLYSQTIATGALSFLAMDTAVAALHVSGYYQIA